LLRTSISPVSGILKELLHLLPSPLHRIFSAAFGAENNNNNLDDIYSAVIYGASHMREFTVVHLGQSRPAPGGRQLAGQAANLTFESACRLLEAEHSPIATENIAYVDTKTSF